MEEAKKSRDFGDVLRGAMEAKGLSNRSFADAAGLKANTLSNYLNNVSRPNFETLVTFTKILGVSSDYLLGLASEPQKGHPNGHLNGHLSPNDKTKRTNFKEKPKEVVADSALRTEFIVATQDTTGNPTFTVVGHKAAANYLTGYESQEYVENLGAVTLPQVVVGSGRQGIFLQIEGDSMTPRFQHGDWVACTLLDRSEWHKIRDNDCYVVVSTTYGIQFKRLKNCLATSQNFIRCRSDNPRHRAFTIDEEDLLQVFQFVLHVSPDDSNPEDALYNKVDHLEDTTSDLRVMYEQLREELVAIRGKSPSTGL